ncbi:hypothetical protein SLE2022_180180 [Rubroshorea leprosula]
MEVDTPSMEDPQPVQDQPQTQVTDPPSTAEAPPPPTPASPPPPPSLPSESKKRPLDNSNGQLVNSKYYKMRLIVKELRPHFIEVLRTPDFRNCKAANEIKERMELLMELYNQMPAETVSSEKQKEVLESQPLAGVTGPGQKPQEQPQVVKPTEPSENKTSHLGFGSAKQQQPEDKDTQGTYIVGGSAFGWNFVTYSGNAPVYCGVTKESFRSTQAEAKAQTQAQAKTQEQNQAQTQAEAKAQEQNQAQTQGQAQAEEQAQAQAQEQDQVQTQGKVQEQNQEQAQAQEQNQVQTQGQVQEQNQAQAQEQNQAQAEAQANLGGE